MTQITNTANLVGYPQSPKSAGQLLEGETGYPVNDSGGGTQPTYTVPYKQFEVTNGSLSPFGIAIIYHNFKSYPSGIEVQDGLGNKVIVPVKEQTLDAIALDFSDFSPLPDTYKVTVGL